MKLVKVLFTTVIILAILGFGVYHFGPILIADKVVDQVTTELNDRGQVESVKKEINKDPQLRAMLEEGKKADSSKLPFKTKEEATKVLLKKFSIADFQDAQSKAQDGLSVKEKQELLKKLESNLTNDEMLALKYVAYKEIYK